MSAATRPPSAVELAETRRLVSTGAAQAIREGALLTVPEVAAHLGCDASTVRKWEAGERQPKGQLAVRYVRLLWELRDPMRRLRRGPSDQPAVVRQHLAAMSEAALPGGSVETVEDGDRVPAR